jgi:hypothetical protein
MRLITHPAAQSNPAERIGCPQHESLSELDTKGSNKRMGRYSKSPGKISTEITAAQPGLLSHPQETQRARQIRLDVRNDSPRAPWRQRTRYVLSHSSLG